MVVERQLTEAFYNIKPHIDAITQALRAYDMPTTFLTFFGDRMEMGVINDISVDENQVLNIEYRMPVEEQIRIDQHRVRKEA